MKEKIKNRKDLASHLESLRKNKKKIVLATGCFDILHAGHIDLFRRAKKMGDTLLVGINSDASIRKIKGPPRPFIAKATRLANIASLEMVDYVTSFNELTPSELIHALKPDIFVKAGDWKGKELPEAKIIKKYGGKIVFVPITIKTSTTAIAHEENLL